MDDSNSQTLATGYISHSQMIKITGIFTQCSEYLLVRHPKGGKLTINNLKMSNFPWVAPTPSWGKPLIAIGALQKKTQEKRGIAILISSQKDNQGKISALNDHLLEGTGARFKTSIFLISKSYCN